MNKQLFLLGLGAFLSLCCYSCKVEKLALAGSGWQEIVIVDKKSGAIEWKHALDEGDECNDIEVTPKGDILYAYSKGARLIDRNHQTIWDYKAQENEEIHTATRLKDGGYMLAVCGQPKARIVELDKDGKQVKEISFHTATFDTHNQFRQVMKTDSDIYLVPLMEKRKIIQVTPRGGNAGSIFLGTDVFSVKLLKNNNLLVSCGKDGKIIEIDRRPDRPKTLYPKDKIDIDVKGGILLYVGEIFLYENGNKLIANSNMYSDDKSQPLLYEVNADNEVVWSLPFNKEIKNITAVYSFF